MQLREAGEGGWMDELTPRQIVAELDRYIIGQGEAKKAVAIALRNRWRRQRVPDELRDEILPNNLILIGPTGVGKTEVARRLARLAGAPFVKVEASKFTEVGYVGRDVESMIRDLVDTAVNLVRAEREEEVEELAEKAAEERLLDLLLPPLKPETGVRVETARRAPSHTFGGPAVRRRVLRLPFSSRAPPAFSLRPQTETPPRRSRPRISRPKVPCLWRTVGNEPERNFAPSFSRGSSTIGK